MQTRIVLFGGCGTVGQRTRDAIHVQKDMAVHAIVTRSAKENVLTPYEMGIPIYTVEPKEIPKFEKLGIAAKPLKDLLAAPDAFDLVIDCSPDGQGMKNKTLYYAPLGIKAILEGGEDGAGVDVSFNALANYDDAKGK